MPRWGDVTHCHDAQCRQHAGSISIGEAVSSWAQTVCDSGSKLCIAVSQAGTRVAEAMAEAFQHGGHLEVNFVKVVQVNNEGTQLL